MHPEQKLKILHFYAMAGGQMLFSMLRVDLIIKKAAKIIPISGFKIGTKAKLKRAIKCKDCWSGTSNF